MQKFLQGSAQDTTFLERFLYGFPFQYNSFWFNHPPCVIPKEILYTNCSFAWHVIGNLQLGDYYKGSGAEPTAAEDAGGRWVWGNAPNRRN